MKCVGGSGPSSLSSLNVSWSPDLLSPCVKLEFWNSCLYCDVHSFDSCSDSETEKSAEATLNATVAPARGPAVWSL